MSIVPSKEAGMGRSLAYSPDRKNMVMGHWSGLVSVWDTKTGRQMSQLSGHDSCVSSVVYSPDGKNIASGGWDRRVRVWDASTGQHVRTLIGHTGYVFSVAYSPDGKHIASGSDDGTVRVWDVQTGQCVSLLVGHTLTVNSVAYSPDGQNIASGGDQNVRIWDVKTGQCILVLKGYDDIVTSVAYSPVGNYITVIVSSGKVYVLSGESCIWSGQYPASARLLGSTEVFYQKMSWNYSESIPFFSLLTFLTGVLSIRGGGKLSDPRIWEQIGKFL